MPVSSEVRRTEAFVGTGSVSQYPFNFLVFSDADVEVVVANALGVEAVLELHVDYEVELNENQVADPGGNVILFDPLAVDFRLVITSDVPELQETDLANQGGFYPAVVTRSLDRLTVLVQQLRERLSRAAVLPITSDADADSLVGSILVISSIQDQLALIAANLPAIAAAGEAADDIAALVVISADITALAAVASDVQALGPVASQIQDVGDNLAGILGAAQAATDAALARDQAEAAQGAAEDARDAAEAAALSVNPSSFVPRIDGGARIGGWTTAGRPPSPQAGDFGYNSTLGRMESWNGTAWTSGGITESAVVPTTSGTEHVLTGVPATHKRVTLHFDNLNTSGSNNLLVQIGSGALTTSGYTAHVVTLETANNVQSSSGVPLRRASSSDVPTGSLTITRVPGTFKYIMVGQAKRNGTSQTTLFGEVTLSGVMDRVGVIRQSSDTFTGGNIFFQAE